MLAIVDTGCANLASVGFAFDRFGADYKVTQNADEIYGADHVLIPGVGSAPYAMNCLRERSLIPVLQNLTQPVMGICLGMQLIFDHSEEVGGIDCLGMVDGAVEEMETGDLPSPHMGWNTLDVTREDPLLEGVKSGSARPYPLKHSLARPMAKALAQLLKAVMSMDASSTLSVLARRGPKYFKIS